jgi:hypothetical protein
MECRKVDAKITVSAVAPAVLTKYFVTELMMVFIAVLPQVILVPYLCRSNQTTALSWK